MISPKTAAGGVYGLAEVEAIGAGSGFVRTLLHQRGSMSEAAHAYSA